MDLKRIGDKAKDLVDKRGGTGSLKKDAAELKDIAGGEGSLMDKAKAAVEAIKDPGDDAADPADKEAVIQEEPAADAEPVAGERERRRRGRGRGHGRRRAQGRN
jgi:hypothetical protein